MGRTPEMHGNPLDLTQMLAVAKGSVYLERVAVNSPKNIARAAKAIKKAFQVQLDGLGFALVEVLSMCPTNWKMSAVASAQWIDKTMSQVFPLGVIKDETGYQAKEGKAS
jgi:2-oxoglutarate ferredoxin oxidoreductase subunit beta